MLFFFFLHFNLIFFHLFVLFCFSRRPDYFFIFIYLYIFFFWSFFFFFDFILFYYNCLGLYFYDFIIY